jgi:hypothetical protein
VPQVVLTAGVLQVELTAGVPQVVLTAHVLQVVLTAGALSASARAVFALYDDGALVAAEASGALTLRPPWVDVTGADNLTLVASGIALFSPTDRPRMRVTAQPASSNRLASLHLHRPGALSCSVLQPCHVGGRALRPCNARRVALCCSPTDELRCVPRHHAVHAA